MKTGAEPHEAVAADFNGDGVLDVAVGNTLTGDYSVLLGKKGGMFGAAVTKPIGDRPYSAVAGDFNHDGRKDLD